MLARIFTEGRTFSQWQSRQVEKSLLKRAFDLAALGPTSMNCQPARFLLLDSAGARERVLRHVYPGNVDKIRNAPCTVVIARDSQFFTQMGRLFPHKPGVSTHFEANPDMAFETARQNCTLTIAYFIMALRALGLDCGPMGGFAAKGIDSEFFPEGDWKTELLLNVGYGKRESIHPRLPRLTWEESWREA